MDWPVPQLEAERQVGDSQSWKMRGNLHPRDGVLHQTASRLPVANQVFLGSWTVGIHQWGPGAVGSIRRATARDQLPRGDTRHS